MDPPRIRTLGPRIDRWGNPWAVERWDHRSHSGSGTEEDPCVLATGDAEAWRHDDLLGRVDRPWCSAALEYLPSRSIIHCRESPIATGLGSVGFEKTKGDAYPIVDIGTPTDDDPVINNKKLGPVNG